MNRHVLQLLALSDGIAYGLSLWSKLIIGAFFLVVLGFVVWLLTRRPKSEESLRDRDES